MGLVRPTENHLMTGGVLTIIERKGKHAIEETGHVPGGKKVVQTDY